MEIAGGALSQGCGVRARPFRSSTLTSASCSSRLEVDSGDHAAGKPASPRDQNPGHAGTVCRSVSQCAVHARRIGAGAEARSSTGGWRRARLGRNRPVRPHRARRRSPRGGFLPVGDVRGGCPVSLERRDAMAAGTFGGNYRLEQQPRPARNGREAPCRARIVSRRNRRSRHCSSRANSIRSRRRQAGRSAARPFQRRAHRHPQQRSSDRQRRSLHWYDVRPVSRCARSVAGLDRTLRRRHSGAARSSLPGKQNEQPSVGSAARPSRAAQHAPLHVLHDCRARDWHRGDDGAVQCRARVAGQAAALRRCRSAGGGVGAQPAAQPAAQRRQPRQLSGMERPEPIIRAHGRIHAESRDLDRQRRAAGALDASSSPPISSTCSAWRPMLGRGFAKARIKRPRRAR